MSLQGDSNSFIHQKKLLSSYAQDHGFHNTHFFVDAGFSGTNFQRPGFQEMLSEIEAGKIGAVIVKDISRLGRDYLKVGFYTEIFFPQENVRFIAVNNGIGKCWEKIPDLSIEMRKSLQVFYCVKSPSFCVA